MPRSRNRRPAACTSAARFSAAFFLVTFNGRPPPKNRLDVKDCGRHYSVRVIIALTIIKGQILTHLRSKKLVEKQFEALRRCAPSGAGQLCCRSEPRFGRCTPAP